MTTMNTSTPQHASLKPKEKLSESLKACNEILKELFNKKHSVSFVFYFIGCDVIHESM